MRDIEIARQFAQEHWSHVDSIDHYRGPVYRAHLLGGLELRYVIVTNGRALCYSRACERPVTRTLPDDGLRWQGELYNLGETHQ